jgi:hypothetical protein
LEVQLSNKYLEVVRPAIDQYGIIAQLSGDGGDSSQREGQFMLYSYAGYKQGKITKQEYDLIVARYLTTYDRLRKGCMPGEIRRHDGSEKWTDKNLRMSRDQWTPNAISIGLVGTLKQKFNLILGMAMRGFLFTTNIYSNGDQPTKKVPDLTLLSAWGFVMRWSPIFWPLLFLTDLDLLFGSFIWLYRFKLSPGNTDILNHVNALIQAKYRCPTPISWLARKILPLDKVQDCLDRYFGTVGPALNVIAKDVLPEVWK